MKTFFQNLDEIDSIIELGASPENAANLVEHMKDVASTAYVFDRLEASWLGPLESIGYFRDIFSKSRRDGERPQSTWSVSAYLKKMATGAKNDYALAQTLQRILSFIPSPLDFYTFRDVVDATVLLPREMRHTLVPLIQRAINKDASLEFSNITHLLSVLAEEGDISSALRIFSSVFSVFQASSGEENERIPLGADPISPMNPWHYGEELRKCLPALSDAAGIRFLSCLCDILARYLHLSNRRPSFPGPDDFSYIWRPAIEEHSQNLGDDVREALVTGIRDCATRILATDPAKSSAIVELLDSQQWFIFTRIMLYLVGESPSISLGLIAQCSTEPFYFSEVGVRHEYSRLLRNRFRILTGEQQESVLKMIDNGPDKQAHARTVEQFHKRAISPEELGSYVRRWQYDWLSFIAEDLPREWKSRFLELQNEFGAPEHPDFPFHMASGFAGPGRLLGAQLQSPSGDETSVEDWISEYRDRIQQNSEPTDVEADNFAERLQNAVQANPQSAVALIGQFEDLPPRFLAVIAAALQSSPDSDHPNVRSLCLHLSVRVSEALMPADSAASSEMLRNSLTNVLDQYFRDDGKSIDVEQALQLRKIAKNLLPTVRPDSIRSEQQSSDDFDPLFWAINKTDGRIIENSIKLALRDRKLQDEAGVSSDSQWLFDELSRILAEMPDNEVQISAILGYRFPWLIHLAKNWATGSVDDVFPTSELRRWRWEAAWCSYIAFSGVYNDVLGVLRSKYQKAGDELTAKHLFIKSRIETDRGLAQHLAVYYWRQLVSIDDPLLATFMENSDEKTVRSFLHHLGQGIREVKDIPNDVARSLQVLAEWMVSNWKSRLESAERGLSAFGWWFTAESLGDLSWRLNILRSAVEKAGKLDDIDGVLQGLDRVAEDEPAIVIECIMGLIRRKPEGHDLYYLASHSLGIIEKANAVANETTKVTISDIANFFGTLGHFEYRPFA